MLVPTTAAERFQLSAAKVQAAWGDKTRGVLLASPSNPTGTSIHPQELAAVHQVVRDLVYDGPTMRKLAAIAREAAGGADGVVTAARFRDATSLGRKRAIQILEYFDRSGLLRRVGDEHRLRSDSRLFID